MIKIITLFLAAIGGIIFANIVTHIEDKAREERMKEKEKRKRLGKKWYED